VSEATYDHTFAVNTKRVFFGVQRLAPLVRDGGAFVFTTSIADAVGTRRRACTRALRQPSSPSGACSRPSSCRATSRERGEPRLRQDTVDEVARAVLFLGFEATFTTGSELVLDGGITTLVAPTH
jgi:NAD(P)-dependent dehydrogenase (short-subunit alcohol dehydrogenase family)